MINAYLNKRGKFVFVVPRRAFLTYCVLASANTSHFFFHKVICLFLYVSIIA